MYAARLRMPLLWGALVLLVAGLALYLRVGTVRRPPVEVAAPVAGRWTAVNSPADKVPSHGLHAYDQTYAIDLVHEPGDGSRPAFGPTGSRSRSPRRASLRRSYRLQWVSPSR